MSNRSYLHPATSLVFSLVTFFVVAQAAAQEPTREVAPPPSPGASAEDSAVQPPRLVVQEPVAYPEAARAAGREAVVFLRLTIDAQGRVTEAEVSDPAGHGFDEAARSAALKFQFEPATRGGVPVAARILYHYAFVLEAPLPATAAASPPRIEPIADGAQPTATGEEKKAHPAVATGNATAGMTEPIEVVVQGSLTEAERLQQSAEAVTVVDTRKARQRAADTGAVLARTQGITVRRGGGLGTDTRISLNGLYDNQVRFFMDGVPLALTGYPLDVANVPVNLIDRIDVYRGVVPVRFGADALGGAVNLITNESYEAHLGASYQVGSFGTHRVSASGRYRHEPTSLIFGASAFYDVTQNNYDVDVHVPDDDGRQIAVTVPRFHDAYEAYGANAELGIVDQGFARRLVFKVFETGFEKEIQSNNVMADVYGEVRSGERIRGATGRYDVGLSSNVDLELVASYAYRAIEYTDTSKWVYNWFGQRVNPRRSSAEANDEPEDNRSWEHGWFARAVLAWTLHSQHVLRAVFTPALTQRTGDELIAPSPTAFDPLTARNQMITLVSGVEYESSWFNDRLSNVLFVKDYVYETQTEEPQQLTETFKTLHLSVHKQGVGDSLRYHFTPWLLAKISYEYATRLPDPDEVFGDAQQTAPNLNLRPETSHNANVGPRLKLERPEFGVLTLDLNAFLRDTDQQIILLGGETRSIYQNVYGARSTGLECGAALSALQRMVNLDATLTWQDLRNTSSAGAFGDFAGDPIPNRPHLFGSWGASVQFSRLPGTRDRVELFYLGRYVHEFFRSWESAGVLSSKQMIPTQTTHDAGVTWSVTGGAARVASTFEIDNVTDAKVYDEFGMQRPGRAYYVKVSGDL